jgi:uncharacterized protein with HEPN domain
LKQERRGDRLRTADILGAIEKIQRWSGEPRGEDVDLWRAAVMRQLGIIGEAAAHLSGQLRAEHPGLEWPKIIGLRNRLVHEYWDTKWAIVEKIIAEDLPLLQEALGPGPAQVNGGDEDIDALYVAAQKLQFVQQKADRVTANENRCEAWMPIARARCALPPNHSGHHRS